MPIPPYETMMLPILRYCAEGNTRTLTELKGHLAGVFGVTEEERRQLLPSGADRIFNNRVRWAEWHLVKALLLEKRGRGQFGITDRGAHVLGEGLERVDRAVLRRYPEFVEAMRGAAREEAQAGVVGQQVDGRPGEPLEQETPEETLGRTHRELIGRLAEEVLERLLLSSPDFFERAVVDLLVAMGYGGSRRDAAEAVGRSGDGGIDGVIKEDRLGLDVVLIQAKRWDGSVGRPLVQAFAGALDGHGASKGVLITTSSFTRDAVAYAERITKRIILLDGALLAQLMVEHNVGVTEGARYVVKSIDSDYFDEE